jgi:hypothetical protein
MKRNTKISLLFLITLLQALTIAGIYYAYEQMSNMYWKLAWAHDLSIDYGPFLPNPFSPFILLLFLSLSLTIALIIDEIRQKVSERAEGERAKKSER